jgi:hypothetical protein
MYSREMPMDSMFPRRRADRFGTVRETIVNEICLVGLRRGCRTGHANQLRNAGDAIRFIWPIWLADYLADLPGRFTWRRCRGAARQNP